MKLFIKTGQNESRQDRTTNSGFRLLSGITIINTQGFRVKAGNLSILERFPHLPA